MNVLSIMLAAAAVFAALGPSAELTRLYRLEDQLQLRRTDSAIRGTHSPSLRKSWMASPPGRVVAAAIAALGVTVIIGGRAGLVAGVAAGVGSYGVLSHLGHGSNARPVSAEQTALAAQLLASVLSAGCAPVVAADVVGRAVGGPLGDTLVRCSTAARLGSEPTQAWAALTSAAYSRSLGRAFSIAATRGTSPVPALRRSAEDARDESRWAGEAKTRSLGAKSAAPLGVCFLPAFVLLAIVPVVVTSF